MNYLNIAVLWVVCTAHWILVWTYRDSIKATPWVVYFVLTVIPLLALGGTWLLLL